MRENLRVFDHVTIRVSDRAATEPLYVTVLRVLGIEQTHSDEHYAEWNDFGLSQTSAEKPVTTNLHVAFRSPSREHVDEFWQVGTAAGLRDDGEPGPRPQYSESYYGSFLRDPDGNSIEAVHHVSMGVGGWVDHMWIRVADLDGSKRFYETIAPYAGIRMTGAVPERARFAGASGSFSVVDDGAPTEHLHMAFPVPTNAAVEGFHRAGVEAGYRDNGPPAERPVYHAGYYAAFVLDPDGNNVELVNHNRP
jgi:catechol 2,3-dioxygenase-like lactoylglutathione lyase family enzyme